MDKLCSNISHSKLNRSKCFTINAVRPLLIHGVDRAGSLGMRGKVNVETVMEVCQPLLLNLPTLQGLEGRGKKIKLHVITSTCKAGFVQLVRCAVQGTRWPCSPAHGHLTLIYTFQQGMSGKAEIMKCYYAVMKCVNYTSCHFLTCNYSGFLTSLPQSRNLYSTEMQMSRFYYSRRAQTPSL